MDMASYASSGSCYCICIIAIILFVFPNILNTKHASRVTGWRDSLLSKSGPAVTGGLLSDYSLSDFSD